MAAFLGFQGFAFPREFFGWSTRRPVFDLPPTLMSRAMHPSGNLERTSERITSAAGWVGFPDNDTTRFCSEHSHYLRRLSVREHRPQYRNKRLFRQVLAEIQDEHETHSVIDRSNTSHGLAVCFCASVRLRPDSGGTVERPADKSKHGDTDESASVRNSLDVTEAVEPSTA